MNYPLLFDEDLINHIRTKCVEMDETGVISGDVLEIIYEHGLFKCFLPRFLGGNIKPLPEALRIFEDASRVDGNFGWIVTIGARGGHFAAYIQPEQLEDIYYHRSSVVAGSGFTSGTAKRVAGGYELSGHWKYCSGSTHATIFTFNCEAPIEGNPAMTEIRTFILYPHQVNITEDWDAFGLRATASHSVQVDNQFVEDDMTFIIRNGTQKLHDEIYTYPFKTFSETSFAAIVIGIAKHFIDEAKVIAETNRDAWESSHLNRYEFVLSRIERKQAFLEDTVSHFYHLVDSSWKRHVEKQVIPRTEWELISKMSRRVSRVALDCAHAIFPFLGTSVVSEHSTINCIYRDLHTACQNALLVPFTEEELI